MNDDEPETTRAHAVTCLREAGWSRLDEEPPGGVAMCRMGEDATLSFWYTSAREAVRLFVAFRGESAPVGLFREGSGDFKIYAGGRALLGLICWITSSQEDLCADGAGEWLDQIVTLCPDTYAVVSAPGAPEALARVTLSGEPRRFLH